MHSVNKLAEDVSPEEIVPFIVDQLRLVRCNICGNLASFHDKNTNVIYIDNEHVCYDCVKGFMLERVEDKSYDRYLYTVAHHVVHTFGSFDLRFKLEGEIPGLKYAYKLAKQRLEDDQST